MATWPEVAGQCSLPGSPERPGGSDGTSGAPRTSDPHGEQTTGGHLPLVLLHVQHYFVLPTKRFRPARTTRRLLECLRMRRPRVRASSVKHSWAWLRKAVRGWSPGVPDHTVGLPSSAAHSQKEERPQEQKRGGDQLALLPHPFGSSWGHTHPVEQTGQRRGLSTARSSGRSARSLAGGGGSGGTHQRT